MSTLNPLATTFVPSNVPSKDDYILVLAIKLFEQFIKSKFACADFLLKKSEIATIIEHILSCKINKKTEILSIRACISSKLAEWYLVHELDDGSRHPRKGSSWRLSKVQEFKLPKPTILLVAFWGLYRHEQFLRPTIKLTYRPARLKDKVWSVTPENGSLWNPCCKNSECSCPPMFGYTLPLDFFGNPFSLTSSCKRKEIHVCHYPEVPDGNEIDVHLNSICNYPLDLDNVFEDFNENNSYKELNLDNVFEDFNENDSYKELNLDFYSNQLQDIVNDVCEMLKNSVEGDVNSTTELDENFQFDTASLWDYSLDPEVPKLFNTVAEDNGCHPLLEIGDPNDEGVEIADVIRCLSSEQLIEIESDIKQDVDKQVLCEPPCSIWCDSFVKAPNSLSRTRNFDLLSFTTPGFESKTTSESSDEIFSMTSPEFRREFPSSRPFFKRSLSVNDTESVYNQSSVFERTRSQDSINFSTECSYPYRDSDCSRRKPGYVRSVSWKDNDSGIMSHGSSQEDISFPASEMKDYFRSSKENVISTDGESMWGLFGGANSLWQQLPECVPSNDQVNRQVPHKRVRDLKRLKSLN